MSFRLFLRPWRYFLAALALALTLLLIAGQSLNTVQAARQQITAGSTYVVNSTADLLDADPVDGLCAAANGACTLRAAIMQANFSSGFNTITLPSGVYLLTRVNLDDTAVGGDLDISEGLTIQGAGSGATIVDGNGPVTNDRVFHILSPAGRVSLSALTIRNGKTPSTVIDGLRFGGGIFREGNASSAALDLSDVLIESNTAGDGGGLYAWSSDVTLDYVTLRANTAVNQGGGLWVDGSILTIHDSQVYSNTADEGGGFAFPTAIYLGSIERIEMYANTANRGGAIANGSSARLPLVDSYLHNNYAATGGGAIYHHAYVSLVISRTVLDANSSGLNGGGIMITNTTGSQAMLIADSTLSHNAAQYGGAIYQHAPVGAQSGLVLVNSTLSHNSASHDGGGIYATGSAQSSLFNTTLASNLVARPVGQSYPARGGGLFITLDAIIRAQNSIIADNGHVYGVTLFVADDCFTSGSTTFQSNGYNLLETTTDCTLSGTTFGNVTGQDPQLGPLQLNGGATSTRALLSGSPALDAGDLTGCKNENNQPLTRDQRGWRRPIGARCDIGAVEVGPSVYLPLIRRD